MLPALGYFLGIGETIPDTGRKFAKMGQFCYRRRNVEKAIIKP